MIYSTNCLLKEMKMRNILNTVIAFYTVEKIVKLWYNSTENEAIITIEELYKYSEKKIETE